MKTINDREKHLRQSLANLDQKLHQIEDELEQPMPKDFEDRASEREEDEVLEGLGNAGLQKQRMIKAALKRIKNGTYGICVKCGNEISQERLDVLPYTPKCHTCAN